MNNAKARWLLLCAACVCASATQAQGDEAWWSYLAATQALGSEALDSMRGGAEVVNNDLATTGEVASNTASQLVTGSNFVSTGALEGASGFSTVVQNTGNNVLIQNATIINLQLQ